MMLAQRIASATHVAAVPAVTASGPVEVVRLASGEPLVPADVLTPPFREEGRGLLRDLAALLLDRHLRRLARMRNPVDLRLGRLLWHLDRASGCVALGFARLADYAAERLGLPARRARDLVTLARGLAPLPRLAAAFEAGDVSRSQVHLLLRVATPDTESTWLARARSLNVRLLDREVRAALADGAARDGVASSDIAASDIAAPAGAAPNDDASATDDDSSPGEWVDVPVPRRLRPLWDQAVELARRTSGAPDPPWSCIEIMAADFLAGVPDLASLLARETASDAPVTDPGAPDFAAPDPGAPDPAVPLHGADRDDTDLFEEVIRSLEDDAGARRAAPALEGLAVLLPESAEPRPDDTPRALDRRLRELVALRQNIAWHQGRLLRLFVDRRLYRELGFLSLSRYCRERAGLGVRRAWDLIALERRLWLLPRIADAYRSGALSWVRAAAIARVATERTEDAWLRLAQSVTVRRLAEEVALVQQDDGPPSYGHASPPGLDAEGRVQLSAPVARPGIGPARESGAPDDSAQSRDSHAAGAGVQTSVAADGWTRLRFWAPQDIAALWHQAMRAARAILTAEDEHSAVAGALAANTDHAGAPPPDWRCAERILTAFIDSWSVRADPAWRRHHRIFERDAWRCRVPGCSSRRNLQVHHVVFRSQGGSDEDANLAVLCAAHHLQGIHRGRVRCHPLPGGLLAWEFAPDLHDEPLARFVEDVEWTAARASVA
jgi:HNH endonuclease